MSAIDEGAPGLVIACEQQFINFEESLKDLGYICLSWQIDWIVFRLDTRTQADKTSAYPGLYPPLPTQDVV
jgi:hypothetical protein